MELPLFNPQGTGPQGTAGIPPEEIRQGLREAAQNPNAGVELITGSMKPEDSQVAQTILAREAEQLLASLGVQAPQEATPQQAPAPTTQETPSPPPPPVQQQAPSSEPAAAVPPQSDLEARVAKIREKYKGNYDELAKSYAHTDAARTRAQQDRATLEGRVLLELETVKAQLAALTPREPSAPQTMRDFLKDTSPPAQPQQAAPAPQTAQDETDFYARVEGIVNKAVQTNLIALKEAEIRHDRQRKFQETLKQSQEEMSRLRPIILQVYNEDRELYDSLEPETQHRLLLKNARDRELALAGLEIYQEVTGSGEQPGNAPRGAPGPGASLPSGGSTVRSITAPAPPNGDWSNTQGMKRLWKTADGSVDETRTMMKVLEERGVGDWLK